MGVKLRPLLEEYNCIEETEIEGLKYQKVAIDAFNALYQFITIIRQRDGKPLMDSKGRITSHLSGLFYRTINLLKNGIKPIYVYDGEPPKFKKVLKEREEKRKEAEEKFREALEEGRYEDALTYAKLSAKINDFIIESSKKLLDAMGIPWIQAPSEGEAQCAYLTIKGDVDASSSQDYDSLLFGSKLLIRNLTITGRRKLPKKNIYVELKPERIYLDKVLEKLKLTRKGLILIGLLTGTDYNPEGIRGIGPKKAYEIVRRYREDEDKIFKVVRWNFDVDYHELINWFLNPKVTDDYKIEFKDIDKEEVKKILVDEFEFSEERVENALKEVKSTKTTQSFLTSFFK